MTCMYKYIIANTKIGGYIGREKDRMKETKKFLAS